MHLVFYTRDRHENPRGRKAEEWGVPAYLSLQTLSTPGVMYFISLVRFPRIENPSMSVRRPGTVLGYSESSSAGPILQERYETTHLYRFQTLRASMYDFRT